MPAEKVARMARRMSTCALLAILGLAHGQRQLQQATSGRSDHLGEALGFVAVVL